jgi:adenylylsulfate kinase
MEEIANQNTVLQEPVVYRKDREIMNGHKSIIIWFTGLSGSGKSTIAYALEDILHRHKIRTFVLDGDNIRQGLCRDLGFSSADRVENIRRIGEVSKLMMEAGSIVLAAFISPFKKDRKIVRESVVEGDFVEIFCNAPLDICESRDVKGFYKKARTGEIPEFTGISSPYEAPDKPELILDTNVLSVEECLKKIISYISQRQIIKLNTK